MTRISLALASALLLIPAFARGADPPKPPKGAQTEHLYPDDDEEDQGALPWQRRAEANRIVRSLRDEMDRAKKDLIDQASKAIEEKSRAIQRQVEDGMRTLLAYVFLAAAIGGGIGGAIGVYLNSPRRNAYVYPAQAVTYPPPPAQG